MKNADMNIVISWGLVVMGIIAVIGWIILSYKTGTSSGTEIPIAIVSGLGGVLTGKNLADKAHQNKMAEIGEEEKDVQTMETSENAEKK